MQNENTITLLKDKIKEATDFTLLDCEQNCYDYFLHLPSQKSCESVINEYFSSVEKITHFTNQMLSDYSYVSWFLTRDQTKPLSEKDSLIKNVVLLIEIAFQGKANTILESHPDYYTFYTTLLEELLTIKCGTNVRKVYIKEETDMRPDSEISNYEKSVLYKVKLPNENLLYWSSVKEVQLWLQYNEDYQRDVARQFENQSTKRIENLMVQLQKADEIAGFPNRTYHNPYDGFTEKYPYSTYYEVDQRTNPKMIKNIYLSFPINANPCVQTILKNQNEHEKIDKNKCPLFFDMYGYQYGLPIDVDEPTDGNDPNYRFKRLFTQENRVNLTHKVISSVINMDFLKDEGLLCNSDALHYYHDLEVIKFNMASFWKFTHALTTQDLLLINNYWGSEIAFYYLFVNFLAKEMTSVAYFSVFLFGLSMILTSTMEYSFIGTSIITFVFSMTLVFFTTVFLEKWKREEGKWKHIWGITNIKDDYSKISGYNAPFQYDLVKERLYRETHPNAFWKAMGIVSVCVLIFGMILTSIYCMSQSQYHYDQFALNGNQIDNIYGILYGMLISVSIKIFGTVYFQISFYTNKRENHQYWELYFDNLAMKTFIFNYVITFFTTYYIAFIKKRMIVKACTEIELFDGIMYESCLYDLQQYVIIQVMTFLAMNVVELGTPYALQWVAEKTTTVNKEAHDPHAFLNMNSGKDDMDNVIFDYLEIMLTMSMVLTFGCSWPICFFIAWGMNSAEIRMDLVKYCYFSMRGNCSRKGGIGIWLPILQIVGILSIAVNLALNLQEWSYMEEAYRKSDPEWESVFADPEKVMMYFLVCQALIMFIQFAISESMPDHYDHVLAWKDQDEKNIENFKYTMLDANDDDNTDNDIIVKNKIKVSIGKLEQSHAEYKHYPDFVHNFEKLREKWVRYDDSNVHIEMKDTKK